MTWLDVLLICVRHVVLSANHIKHVSWQRWAGKTPFLQEETSNRPRLMVGDCLDQWG